MFFFIAYSTNKTLQKLYLYHNQIGDAGAASIGDALMYVQSRHPKFFHFRFLYILYVYWGNIFVYVCFFCSQNSSLKELQLWGNQIGDAGASGIGAGLAYVLICHWRSSSSSVLYILYV